MEWPVDDDVTLGDFLRAHVPEQSWNQLKRFITSGKLFVDGRCTLSPTHELSRGQRVELRMAAPRVREIGEAEVRLVYEDTQVVVIDKPSGISSVPYEKDDPGTALDLVRDAWRRIGRPATSTPLFVVHRIDKETSGLLVFAKTKVAERGLAAQFRAHTVARTYICIAHGRVASQRIESFLVEDRGDGFRGSTREPKRGKRAITHVTAVEPCGAATVCEVRLETGKTHQIRIHLSERGHPIVGEKVYMRDFLERGGTPIQSPRLLLHAATLGFLHPVTNARHEFKAELPSDFTKAVRRIAP